MFDVLCALDEGRGCKTELLLSFECSAMTGGADGQPCSALGRNVMTHAAGLIFPGRKKSEAVPSIAGAEAPGDLGETVEEPLEVVPVTAITEAAGHGRDLLVFYEALDAMADIKLECTNVLCNFANRLAQTNINVSYHNAANSLLAGGGPSQVPTITISAHVGTAIDITWSAAVEDGVGEVREGVGRLRKLDETAFELVWREQETFELEISVNTPKDFDTDPTVDVGVRLTENVTAHDILFVLDSSFEVQKRHLSEHSSIQKERPAEKPFHALRQALEQSHHSEQPCLL